MTITDIIAKVAGGEAFTDEERAFAGSYDHRRELDAAAGASRKRAERERDEARAEADRLRTEFDEFREANDPDRQKGARDALERRIAKLEALKAESDARAAKLERTAKIRAFAKDAGITAAKGIDSKTLDACVDGLMADVDLEDADAVKAALDGFKAANAGMIAAQTVGGAGALGLPGAGGYAGANPFRKGSVNLTEQMRLLAEAPETANALRAAAAAANQ